MIDFSKIKIGFENICFENRKLSDTAHRKDNDVLVEFANNVFRIPVGMSNMKSIQDYDLIKKLDSSGVFYSKHRIDGAEEVLDFCEYAREHRLNYFSISIGIGEQWVKFLHRLKKEQFYPDCICLDVANSFNLNIIEICRTVYQLFPYSFFIVGNGMTREWINWLENIPETRVDAAKVSIGVSQSCKTYHYTGYKSSTISHLEECADAAKRVKIISDGGLTLHPDGSVNIGDVAKAIRFGADFVWSGSIWARCIDNPAFASGYWGNSTAEMKGYSDHIEGCLVDVSSDLEERLTTEETISHIIDSLQSSISYVGGKNLADLRQASYWIKL